MSVRPGWKTRAGDFARRGLGQLAVGLNGLFGSRADERFGILGYHRIVAEVPGFAPPFYNVEPKHFSEQLTGLLERHFQFWPLSRVLAAAQRREPLPPRVVVLTFDDAYGNVYSQAWPILKRLELPATVFLATAFLDSEEPFPFDPWGLAHRGLVPTETYRPLKTAECREMADSGLVEIGSHTHTHKDFRGRPDAFRADVLHSVELLRDRFAIDPVMFCFPWGAVHNGFASGELALAAQDAGATCGLTTEIAVINHLDSPFKWGRFNVFDWDTGATLAAKLGGWYFRPRARRPARTQSQSAPANPAAAVAVTTKTLIQEHVS
jgi:peptidoglycan/xylan/chitin deacetylase (PgdA/CDA1 family)